MKDRLPRRIFSSEHDDFRDAVRRFVAAEVTPNIDAWSKQGHVDRSLYTKAAEMGLMGIMSEEAYGGGGATDYLFNAILLEEMAQSGSNGATLCLNVVNDLSLPYLDRFASEDLKQRYIPGVCSGETILAIAMTEPAAGSDLAGMRTTATRTESGDWVINGSKIFISNGWMADAIVVAAVTSKEAGRGGISLFVVDADAPGFSRQGPMRKIGQKCSDTAELYFDNCQVPAGNLIGEEGKGFDYLRQNLVVERLSVAITSMGLMRRAYDLAFDYATVRETFGKKIIEHQAIRFYLAEMATVIAVTQSFLDECTVACGEGTLDEATASMAKWWATENHRKVVDTALQIHGGYGFMEEYEISRHYLDSRVDTIYAGSTEIMKEVIGRRLAQGR